MLNTNFDKGSKKLGFRIPEHRCWCGKEGKYPATNETWKLFGTTHVCKKHRDEN